MAPQRQPFERTPRHLQPKQRAAVVEAFARAVVAELQAGPGLASQEGLKRVAPQDRLDPGGCEELQAAAPTQNQEVERLTENLRTFAAARV
jgi:hypothetical protein